MAITSHTPRDAMDLHEQRIYLRNLITVAKADDVVLIEENDFLVEVCQTIGYDSETLPALLAEKKHKNVDLIPLGRYSDRIRCLEDLIEMAMADGEVARDEKVVLFHAAQEVNIDRDTVKVLIMEAQERRDDRFVQINE